MNEPALNEPGLNEPGLTEPAVNEPAKDDIAALQKRVETAGDRFSRMAEQQRTNGTRLAGLLQSVEERFACSRLEIDRLGGELTHSKEENQQLRGWLQSLLAAAEDCGQTGDAETMGGLEQRISSLLSETAAEPENGPAEAETDGEEEDEDENEDEDPPSEAESEAGPAAGGRTAEPNGAASSDPTTDDDLTAVTRIIQRISLLTGDFVDQKRRTADHLPANVGMVGSLAARAG